MHDQTLRGYVTARNPTLAALMNLLLAVAWVTLAVGLYAPIMTTTREFWWFEIDRTTWSLAGGIATLFTDGHAVLAAVVALFTVVVPVFKIGIITLLWNGSLGAGGGRGWLGFLSFISKWSMLDVFVVGIVIVVSKLSSLADAQAREAIYVFGGHVLLSMVLTKILHHYDRQRLQGA